MKILKQIDAESFYQLLSESFLNDKLTDKQKFYKFYSIIKSVYKLISQNEKQIFLSFSNISFFVNSKYEIPEELIKKINLVKKIEYKLRHNKTFEINSEYISYSYHTALDLINFFSDESPDYIIAELIEKVDVINFDNKKFKSKMSDIEFLRVAVVDKGNRIIDKGKILSSELICYNDEIGEIKLHIYGSFAEIHKFVWKGCILNLLNIKLKKENDYFTSIDSLIILEPDYLLDITEIAECFSENISNYKLFFLKKFSEKKTSFAMVLGNLVNCLFDELVRNNEISFADAFKTALIQKPLQLFVLKKNDNDVAKIIRNTLEIQFETLKQVLNEIKADYYSIEPSFISPLYGLQGRLDLLLEYKEDHFLKDIVELKSGNPPSVNFGFQTEDGNYIPTGVWVNHLMQTTGYNLLLDSAFDNRRGSSMILYSKAEFMQLRNTPNINRNKQLFIQTRNRIIAEEKKLESGKFGIFKLFNNEEFGVKSAFLQKDLVEFSKVYTNFTELEYEYFTVYYKFILRELLAEKFDISDEISSRGNSTSYWSLTQEEKEESISILRNLQLIREDSDFGNLHLKFKWLNEGLDTTTLRKGDLVILYPDDKDFNPTKRQLIKCVIRSFENGSILISIRNKLFNIEIFDIESNWIVEYDQMDTNTKRLFGSVFEFLSTDLVKKQMLFGLTQPTYNDTILTIYDELGTYRNEIISKAINAANYYLIQGPPGTGKTSYILKYLVKYLAENTTNTVLILAYTNRAVDEICKSISTIGESCQFLRLGTKEATDDTSNLIAHLAQNLPLKNLGELIQNTRFIVSTVYSALSNSEIFELKDFDLAIIDEASQILEPQIIGILSKVDKFIMIGDEKQLPAVVTQRPNLLQTDSNILHNIECKNLGMSLFERLIRICNKNGWTDFVGLLNKQARMHKDIQGLVNHLFYNHKLELLDDDLSKFDCFSLNNDYAIDSVLSNSRIIFINTSAEKQHKVNFKEAELTAILAAKLSMLFGNNFSADSIGIASPFRAQCAEISKRLPANLQKSIIVDTIERFQGSERDIILYSVCANNKYMLNNMSSVIEIDNQFVDRKLNVAITRAKKYLFILGNEKILLNSIIYKELITYIKNNCFFIEAVDLLKML